MQETWVRSLDQGRYPGGGHGNHSRVLAWRLLRPEELGRLVHRVTKSQTQSKQLSTHEHKMYFFIKYVNISNSGSWKILTNVPAVFIKK